MALDEAVVRGAPVEAADAGGVFRIWPGDGVPPGGSGEGGIGSTMRVPWTTAERRLSRNVGIPTLTLFRPDPARANGAAIVIAPGGAFHFLMMDHEGYDMARWLAARGATALVLKYRLGRTPERDEDLHGFRTALQRQLGEARRGDGAPPVSEVTREPRIWGEEDGRQAMRFVRAHAAELGIDGRRVGIAGFSAGGGVALGAAMDADPAVRPDFAVGVYPAWRTGAAVPANPPPLFLVIADDDKSVAPLSSVRLYEAWHTAGGPAELHVFGNGGHGFGMAESGVLPDPWIGLCGNWLAAHGFLAAP